MPSDIRFQFLVHFHLRREDYESLQAQELRGSVMDSLFHYTVLQDITWN